MKKSINLLLTLFVMAIYLLLGIATSQDNEFFFIDGFLINNSDSCNVNTVNLIFSVNPNNEDTITVWPQPIQAGDSAYIQIDSLPFHTLEYTCTCPGDTVYITNQAFVQGPVSTFPSITVDCD